MTSQIVQNLFDWSFELIIIDNKGKKHSSSHQGNKFTRRLEIEKLQKFIIQDLRDILKTADSLDKMETITYRVFAKGPEGDQVSTAIFVSRIQDFLKDTKDFGAKALTYQLAYYCRPILVQALPRIPSLKRIIQDITILLSKSTAFYGAYEVENPELSEVQVKKVRTLNTLTPKERFLAGHEFKVYGPDIFTYIEKSNSLKYEKKQRIDVFELDCTFDFVKIGKEDFYGEQYLAIECIEDEYFGYHNPKRRGPAVLYVKFSGLKF